MQKVKEYKKIAFFIEYLDVENNHNVEKKWEIGLPALTQKF